MSDFRRYPTRDPRPPSVLRIPVREFPSIRFDVFFTPTEPTPPTTEALTALTKRWLVEHANDPLRSAIRGFIDRAALGFGVDSRAHLATPALQLLSHLGLGELEERRLLAATHVVSVVTRDSARRPRIGLWSAIAGARAVATELGGVILDPIIPKVLSTESYIASLPHNGDIRIGSHIVVPYSVGDRGVAWMTTSGLAKFGLPDLEISELPPNLDQMSILVNGVAQHLVTAVLLVPDSQTSLQSLEIESEIRITGSEVAAALGREPTVDEARRFAVVGLQFGPSSHRQGISMIQLVRPHGFHDERTVWPNVALQTLLGSATQVTGVPSSSAAMEAAHQKAIAELGEIKVRFQAGLRPGESLIVKYGFPTSNNLHEYMWLLVTEWVGKKVTAQLESEPRERRDLAMGQTIEIAEEDIYDWMLRLTGGRDMGGYTTSVALIEGQST